MATMKETARQAAAQVFSVERGMRDKFTSKEAAKAAAGCLKKARRPGGLAVSGRPGVRGAQTGVHAGTETRKQDFYALFKLRVDRIFAWLGEKPARGLREEKKLCLG